MRKQISAVGVMVVLSLAGSAYAGGSGTSGALVLTQGLNARALAMGESFTAIGGGLASMHYNPAGLGFMRTRQASVLFKRGMADDNTGAIDAGFVSGKGAVALGLLYYSGGNMELIDSAGNERMVNAETDYVVNVSYGYPLSRAISIGGSAKALSTRLVEEVSATAYALDLGMMCRIKSIGIGFAVQNIGDKIKYIGEGDNLPLTMRIGASYASKSLTAGVDAVKQNDDEITEHIGMEYTLQKTVSIRGGYKLGCDTNSITLGLGLRILKGCQFDYAMALMNEFDNAHYASVTFKL